MRSETCGNGEPTAGGSALWRIHPPSFSHFEHGNCDINLAARSFFNTPLPPCPGRMIAIERGLYTTLSAQLTLCFYLRHTLGFEVEENYQCLNPCVYFPRCIWRFFGPFLERKLNRPRHLQSTLRNEPSAASLSLSAIIQESHAASEGPF